MEADEQLRKSWREEQLQIASRVVIPESPTYCQIIKADGDGDNGRYMSMHPSSIISSGPLLVGGVDVSFQDEGNTDAIAVYVILKYNTIHSLPQVVHRSYKWYTLTIPYISSYLAFREIEPLLELISSQIYSKPDLKPDVILVDGNGQWHERKAGIASFVGVKTGIPTVGVGKTFYSIDGLMRKNDVHRDMRMALKSWYHDGMNEKKSEQCTARCLILDTVPIPAPSNNEGNPKTEEVLDDDAILCKICCYFSRPK